MASESTIESWVREHRVTFEIGPLQEPVEGGLRAVGFELRLFGRHATETELSPGFSECLSLHEKLQAIATAALPTDERPTVCEIEPYDHAFHLRPESEWALEVQLVVRIVHRSGYFSAVDWRERGCAEEIQVKLRRLGIQAGRWSEARVPVLAAKAY